jgi:hypothetical protein
MPKKLASQHLEIGYRIPKDYFWVIGWGESDVAIETGSYDAALTMAGIENFNVIVLNLVNSAGKPIHEPSGHLRIASSTQLEQPPRPARQRHQRIPSCC